MYVRLSDPPPADLNVPEYIWIPQTRTWLREDKLDFLKPDEWRKLMAELAAYQPTVAGGQLSEAMYLADKATRKKKREDKKEKKQTKADDKHKKKDAKTEIKKAKAAKKASGAGAGSILGSVVDGLKSFLPGAGGGGEEDPPPDPDPKKKNTDDDDDDEKPFYKTTGFMIGAGVAGLALIGGGIALSRRKS